MELRQTNAHLATTRTTSHNSGRKATACNLTSVRKALIPTQLLKLARVVLVSARVVIKVRIYALVVLRDIYSMERGVALPTVRRTLIST